MKFERLGFVNGEFGPLLSTYDRSRTRIKVLDTGDCVLHEQRVSGTHEFGAEKKKLDSFVFIRGESDKGKDTGVEKY